MKQVLSVHQAPQPGWVGDGFPVRSMFNYQTPNTPVSPFLLLDYAGPREFKPTTKRRGVGEHPHRGFETVTIVYSGEVEHRDNSGGGGVIGPGDVQWMTAGAGLMHEEFHSENFANTGGELEMVQLWVNLPAKDKMTKPGYQAILSDDIPVVQLPNDAGYVRVIAGQLDDQQGAASTFSPVDVWDVRLNAGKQSELSVPEGHSALVMVLAGEVEVNGSKVARAEMAALSLAGSHFSIKANSEAKVLLLSGQPIDEPVVGYGPFVMNSESEILQAIDDLRTGRFGRLN